MPIKTITPTALVDPTRKPLQQIIAEEMRADEHDPARPTVMLADVDGGPHGHKRLFVVWDDPEWAELDRVRRSELALDAYEDAEGVEAALQVTQSWGLTRAEATENGIKLPE